MGEVSRAPENLVGRDFHAGAPDVPRLTDITEFRLPVAWSIGTSPDAELANSSLPEAISRRRAGTVTTIHPDRGGHYRWSAWIAICEANGLVGSMSAKGRSPDNAACGGFFGRLKNEFFHHRDWTGVGAEEFMARLEECLEYFRERRIKRSLGWPSPAEYRRKLEAAPWAVQEIVHTPNHPKHKASSAAAR